MSDTPDATPDDDASSDDYYRNEPKSKHAAHLFDAPAVRDAGGGSGDTSDDPVEAVCSEWFSERETTSYGPFTAYDGDSDEQICGLCLRRSGHGDDEGDHE